MAANSYSEEDGELWAVIPDFVNYRISTWGRILNIRTGRILKPQAYNKDYPLKVGLRAHGEVTTKLVHRLVAEVFLSNFRGHHHVKFKDGDLHNPRLLNLEVSYSGLGQFLGGDEYVIVRMIETEDGDLFKNAQAAADALDVNYNEIQDCVSGRRAYLRGLHLWYSWIEGSFDGDRFVPRPSEGLELVGEREDPGGGRW